MIATEPLKHALQPVEQAEAAYQVAYAAVKAALYQTRVGDCAAMSARRSTTKKPPQQSRAVWD